jgi:hypothetical protein
MIIGHIPTGHIFGNYLIRKTDKAGIHQTGLWLGEHTARPLLRRSA